VNGWGLTLGQLRLLAGGWGGIGAIRSGNQADGGDSNQEHAAQHDKLRWLLLRHVPSLSITAGAEFTGAQKTKRACSA
jgi:hypothetical protein